MIKAFLLSLALLVSAQAKATTCGLASWYNKGSKTANGEKFIPAAATVAHRTLPFGARLVVKYNGKEIVARVTDRGPFIKGRILDVSEGVANALGLKNRGVGHICYELH